MRPVRAPRSRRTNGLRVGSVPAARRLRSLATRGPYCVTSQPESSSRGSCTLAVSARAQPTPSLHSASSPNAARASSAVCPNPPCGRICSAHQRMHSIRRRDSCASRDTSEAIHRPRAIASSYRSAHRNGPSLHRVQPTGMARRRVLVQSLSGPRPAPVRSPAASDPTRSSYLFLACTRLRVVGPTGASPTAAFTATAPDPAVSPRALALHTPPTIHTHCIFVYHSLSRLL